MWRHLLFILPLLLSTSSIKVPVDYNEQNTTEIIPVNKNQNTNVYYITDDANIDSYLVPPDPHIPAESSDGIVTPATYLIPPAPDAQADFYVPAETVDEQSDWLPIAHSQQRPEVLQRKPKASIFHNGPLEKPRDDSNRIVFPIPSTHLEPPAIDAVSEYISAPDEVELPTEDQNQHHIQYRLPHPQSNSQNEPFTLQFNPIEPTLSLILTPPNPELLKAPTKLYPKKFAGGFKPVPIPIAQFSESSLIELPKAKPVVYFKPQSIEETGQLEPLDEKKLYQFQKAEHQRKLKEEEAAIQPQHLADGGATQETYGGSTSLEQETSETNFRYPGRNEYSAPLHQAPAPVAPHEAGPPAPDGRTEFRMHGMKGPHSYQFGYDTGKGKNRQFRYEERDNDGVVRGHYGYMGRNGKLRVVNYSAHPEYGFRAEEPQENA